VVTVATIAMDATWTAIAETTASETVPATVAAEEEEAIDTAAVVAMAQAAGIA
jgi:hypothetical protein